MENLPWIDNPCPPGFLIPNGAAAVFAIGGKFMYVNSSRNPRVLANTLREIAVNRGLDFWLGRCSLRCREIVFATLRYFSHQSRRHCQHVSNAVEPVSGITWCGKFVGRMEIDPQTSPGLCGCTRTGSADGPLLGRDSVLPPGLKAAYSFSTHARTATMPFRLTGVGIPPPRHFARKPISGKLLPTALGTPTRQLRRGSVKRVRFNPPGGVITSVAEDTVRFKEWLYVGFEGFGRRTKRDGAAT